MTTTVSILAVTFVAFSISPTQLIAQGVPPAPGAIWQPKGLQSLGSDNLAKWKSMLELDLAHPYRLTELIDLAEQHNPETRAAWQEAKSRAAALGIARSSLYPTISAVAIALTLRTATLLGEFYHRQTEGIFEPVLDVEYLVFDGGGRSGEIDAAKANLLASDLAFNDTHRRVIYQVASAYYRLLNAEGQRQAAEASLENAKTVEEDATARLANGLATKPDELEATAA